MNRQEMLDRVVSRSAPWDMIIIGGGATGVGCAVDAASRGYEVLLLEQSDFGKGTSSRSTKLIHGGVRYLEQGNISLVMEALRERGILRQNAPHLVNEIAFVVPRYDWWEAPFYGIGLKVYDLLAGKYGFGHSQILSREETLRRLPTIKSDGLRGGIVYYDGQFDDTRLLISLIQTAADHGATLLNYTQVTGLIKDADGFVNGVKVREIEGGQSLQVRGKIVINATGPFADSVRKLAEPTLTPMIAPSQGVHLVFDRSFLPGNSAIMVPHTNDGRVMFAIPWKGHTLVGTTDTPIDNLALDPQPLPEEIDFILETAGRYLHKAPTRADVLSVFVGIRPLVNEREGRGDTAALSRDHTIRIDDSGLLTIAGGKWTTYRNMAEDCINQAATLAELPDVPPVTLGLKIHGFQKPNGLGTFAAYGSDAVVVEDLIRNDSSLGEPLHPALQYCGAEVVWAVRVEMARTVEDVLARRTRSLFLNACAASEMAPRVASIMARELGRDDTWQAQQVHTFRELARSYMLR